MQFKKLSLDLVMTNTADDKSIPFKESQIICLEHQGTCLYGEVIQLILEREMCWFRPLYMTIDRLDCRHDCDRENWELIQLQFSSDLLWPINLFRPALDTEVIALLAYLDDSRKPEQNKTSHRRYLNQFIRQVWAANRDKFQLS